MFSVYLKFDEYLGETGLAHDYNILGEDNFDKIIERYNKMPIGHYAKRNDLGGIGNVDFLISPHPYRTGNTYRYGNGIPPVIAFAEAGEVYYLPTNIIFYWESSFPLDSFAMEKRRLALVHTMNTQILFDALVKLQKKITSNKFGLYYITSKTAQRYQPILYKFKESIMNSFEDIVKSRYDLVFQPNGLEYQLKSLLSNKGINLVDDTRLNEMYPILFKYMVSKSEARVEKVSLAVDSPKGTYQLVSEKSDIFFKPKNYSKIKITPDFSDFKLLSPVLHIDGSSNFTTSVYSPRHIRRDISKFVLDNFKNVLVVKTIIKPFVDKDKGCGNLSIDCKVLCISPDGFVNIYEVDSNTDGFSFESLYRSIIEEKQRLLKSNISKPLTHIVKLDKEDTFINNKTHELVIVKESVITDSEFFESYYRHLEGDSSIFFQTSSAPESTLHITNLFWTLHDYKKWKNIASGFLQILKKSKFEPFLEGRTFISFSTEDLSVTLHKETFGEKQLEDALLKIFRVNKYIDYVSTMDNITEDEVLSIYQEVINYAFFLQKNIVKKYGTIEYFLTIYIYNGRPDEHKLFLLTNNGEKILLNNQIF